MRKRVRIAVGASVVCAAVFAAGLAAAELQGVISNRNLRVGQFIPNVVQVPPAGVQFKTPEGVVLATLVPTEQGAEFTIYDRAGAPHVLLSTTAGAGSATVSSATTRAQLSASAAASSFNLFDGSNALVNATTEHAAGGMLTVAHPGGRPAALLRSDPPGDPYFNTVRMGAIYLSSESQMSAQITAGPRYGAFSGRTPTGEFRRFP
jgi:hypothetical protein